MDGAEAQKRFCLRGDYCGLAIDCGGPFPDERGRVSVVGFFRQAIVWKSPPSQRTTNLELERTRGIRLFN